ncbi:UDP-N-acetylmuramoyl-L-alanyl-D-glutamate--2,6-diaminopimelate ligase, partial [bacterium AH-315-J04]|nr:UDP-N-acetylmuramoyl-L-alanyl-D-glutamate--2,6-diaminopimelate ligase [bacterium AH-315-J04]
RFIESAIRNGAVAIISEDELSCPENVVTIRVKDSRAVLAKLAMAFYSLDDARDKFPLVGITGTNGKTTVAWLLRSIFKAAHRRPATLGTIEYDLVDECVNAPLTTPSALELCRLLNLSHSRGADVAVLEVSSHALEQRRTDGLSFQVAGFTNLSGDHLDFHTDMASYAAAKKRLFDQLPAHAIAVINADDSYSAMMVQDCPARVVRVSLSDKNADVRATINDMTSSGSRFVLHGCSFEADINLALLGEHNVFNAMFAGAIAEALGVDGAAIAEGLSRISMVPGRLQRIEPDGYEFSVLVDYAHTDDALRHVLRAVRPLTKNRLICVFGCGGDRDRSKRPRMAAAAAEFASHVIVTNDNPRHEDPMAIIEDVLTGFDDDQRQSVSVQQDRRLAIELAIELAKPGDTVLIAGKGHEDYQLVGDKVLAFDDATVAHACLLSTTTSTKTPVTEEMV